MFWIIFFSAIMLAFTWFLLAPIRIKLRWDEVYQQFQVHWLGVAQVRLIPIGEEWVLQVRFPFFKKEWPLWQLMGSGAKTTSPPKPKKSNAWRPKHPFRMAKRIWQSFEVRQFHLNMDTNDFVLNAYLFPLFQLSKLSKNVVWTINFEGKAGLHVLLENQLYKLLYAVLR